MKKYFLLLLIIVLSACAPATAEPTATVTATAIPITVTPTAGIFELRSPAFLNGETIPIGFSCKGEDISPALTWTEPPAGTQSFALIMLDPFAGWTHWVLYNIPAETRELKENMPTGEPQLSDGSSQANNSWRTHGYGGPCPPSTHTYVFTLYALDAKLSISPTKFGSAILAAMKEHILASVELTGTFP